MIYPESSPQQYTFGNEAQHRVTLLSYANGNVLFPSRIDLPKPLMKPEDYEKAIEDANDSWGRYEDPKNPSISFELAFANAEGDPENAILEVSTFTSSMSGNPGNSVEFGEHAALDPSRRRGFLAPPGNGKSSYWTPKEQRHIKEHGSYVDAEGKPLPTIAALGRVLEKAGVQVTQISSNSVGGAIGTALMQALPEGQVTHAYFKSRPNISDHSPRFPWGLGVLAHDMLDDRHYKAESKDPYRLTDEMIDKVKEMMPRLYSKNPDVNEADKLDATNAHGLKKMWNDMIANSRAASIDGIGSAAFDTVQALSQQPEALLTYHIPEQDRLYKRLQDVGNFVTDIAGRARLTNDQIQVLMMPGGHRDHSQYPGLRWSAETYALHR